MENWKDNSIQFPRLLAEIASTQEINFEELASQMDLSPSEVRQLFDRAEVKWQEIKAGLVNCFCDRCAGQGCEYPNCLQYKPRK